MKQEGEKSKDTFKIGITQIVAHPALDSAREGFKDAFKESGLKSLLMKKMLMEKLQQQI